MDGLISDPSEITRIPLMEPVMRLNLAVFVQIVSLQNRGYVTSTKRAGKGCREMRRPSKNRRLGTEGGTVCRGCRRRPQSIRIRRAKEKRTESSDKSAYQKNGRSFPLFWVFL